jgi:hypothetical protein
MLIKFLAAISLFGILLPVELEKRTLLDNKIEILVPKDWKPMSEDLIKIKYPGAKPPTYVLSDVSGGISLAFNHTDSRATQGQVETYKGYLKKSLEDAFEDEEWIDDGIKEINGKKVGFLKLVTNTSSGKIYNQMFFTDLDGKLLIISFNVVENKMKDWKAAADEIMNSLTIK